MHCSRVITYVSFAVRVLHRIIIPQLMLDRIQNKPPLLPSLEQSPTLKQVSFVCSIFRYITRKLFVILLR